MHSTTKESLYRLEGGSTCEHVDGALGTWYIVRNAANELLFTIVDLDDFASYHPHGYEATSTYSFDCADLINQIAYDINPTRSANFLWLLSSEDCGRIRQSYRALIDLLGIVSDQ